MCWSSRRWTVFSPCFTVLLDQKNVWFLSEVWWWYHVRITPSHLHPGMTVTTSFPRDWLWHSPLCIRHQLHVHGSLFDWWKSPWINSNSFQRSWRFSFWTPPRRSRKKIRPACLRVNSMLFSVLVLYRSHNTWLWSRMIGQRTFWQVKNTTSQTAVTTATP